MCEQEADKIFCPKWIYYIMPKVHKGMVPPLFSGATGGENNPKTNSNLTWGYLKKKRHDVLNQYKVLLLVKVTLKLINIPFLSLSHYLFHSVLVKNRTGALGQVWRPNSVSTKPFGLLGGYSKDAMSQRSHGKC